MAEPTEEAFATIYQALRIVGAEQEATDESLATLAIRLDAMAALLVRAEVFTFQDLERELIRATHAFDQRAAKIYDDAAPDSPTAGVQ